MDYKMYSSIAKTDDGKWRRISMLEVELTSISTYDTQPAKIESIPLSTIRMYASMGHGS